MPTFYSATLRCQARACHLLTPLKSMVTDSHPNHGFFVGAADDGPNGCRHAGGIRSTSKSGLFVANHLSVALEHVPDGDPDVTAVGKGKALFETAGHVVDSVVVLASHLYLEATGETAAKVCGVIGAGTVEEILHKRKPVLGVVFKSVVS